MNQNQNQTGTSILGNAVLRREDDTLLRGQGGYVGNIAIDGAVHAHFVRSTSAHGEILSVDVDDALSMPGVVAVYTAVDIGLDDRPPPMGFYPSEMMRPFLARDSVRFVGEPVAVVLAETAYQAADAAEAVWIDIRPLSVLVDLDEALAGDTVLFPELSHNV
ncbi:MAG: xanthine dehydrogenase family protein molybdopterin-binding subunit, partial [Acidimicrobiales bacterium]|nr:xanthine dehydrogenase family protein molybdopterin-binding subunit [Acidimicrobiales bacterium]